jgi:hypothetical protein
MLKTTPNQKKIELKYNLNKMGNSKLTKESTMIRKNIKHMTIEEITYLKSMLNTIGYLKITKHAEEKQLIKPVDIKKMIKNKKYEVIDYNYNLDSKEERIMFRSKEVYKVKNDVGAIENCYCKIVISITTNTIITQWMNRCVDEEHKQNNLKNRYCEYFDIINKKIKF